MNPITGLCVKAKSANVIAIIGERIQTAALASSHEYYLRDHNGTRNHYPDLRFDGR